MNILRGIFIVALIAVSTTGASALELGHHRGCAGGCDKVCQLQCTTTTVVVECYGCECDDICLTGPSTCLGEQCETLCTRCGVAECGCKGDQDPLCVFRWQDWKPSWACVRSVKKLVKYQVEKEVPTYKWVVVPGCSCGDIAANHRKPAPSTATVGEEYPLTDAELKVVSRNIVPASTRAAAPAGRNSSRKWWPEFLTKSEK